MQRRLIDAYDQDAVSAREIGDVLRRYDRLDAADRRAFDDVLDATGDDAAEVMAKSDGPARKAMTDGGVDKGFRESVARAADSDAIDSFDQLDDAVQKIDDLDVAAKRQAKDLVDETGGKGFKFVGDLDDSSLQKVMDLDIDRADELRTAFAQYYDQGYADLDEIESFAKHTDSLKGVDGLNSGPVDDFIADADQVPGALHEVDVADDIGTDNIGRMNIEVGPVGKHGEIDIKLESGEVVEAKSSFGTSDMSTYNEFEKKLTAMREHPDTDIDGNTLTIRASEVNNPDRVRDIATDWEDTVSSSNEWGNADVNIRVIDDSDGTVVLE